MNFSKALEAMKEGKKVTRPTFNGKTLIKSPLLDVLEFEWEIKEYKLSYCDIIADDWEIIDENTPYKNETFRQWLLQRKSEIESIISRDELADYSNPAFKYQELFIWNLRKDVIDECIEKINDIQRE